MIALQIPVITSLPLFAVCFLKSLTQIDNFHESFEVSYSSKFFETSPRFVEQDILSGVLKKFLSTKQDLTPDSDLHFDN